ncbi:hypothetical protein JTE90_013465 [Oedothorax gibbosus]|uniref:Uncharacterized protein n=1 Tax=Oedothorax gibbosus TaxID=931172 RepID=A0AAV6VM92_9ARAC|nr:hypothetical protein JTE90_028619 [Oedothorax gibbosus]KAG8197338.1 hypothetical protein JTE90_013465 [Oedothorax gibbosus]
MLSGELHLDRSDRERVESFRVREWVREGDGAMAPRGWEGTNIGHATTLIRESRFRTRQWLALTGATPLKSSTATIPGIKTANTHVLKQAGEG